jgi:hypothetical protein
MTKASCPHCHKFISDEWVKRAGAALASDARRKSKRESNRLRQRAFQLKRKRIQDLLARADFLTVST